MRKKESLADIRKKKTEGVMFRSRCRYGDLGEKPTKYFLSLENRNYQDKVIQHLVDENGEEVDKTKDIRGSEKQTWKTIYWSNANRWYPYKDIIIHAISHTVR